MATQLSQKEHFYDQIAEKGDWDSFANNYETQRRIRLVFEKLLSGHEPHKALFLDAGSGGGHFSAEAQRRGATVVSLDVGHHLLAQVRNRCTSANAVMGSVRLLPFRDNSFQIVLCTEVIEHTVDPLAAVRELTRVVAKDGLLILTVPCLTWQPVVRLATRLRLRPYQGHENFVSFGNLKRTLEGYGMVVEFAAGFNFCPVFWRRLNGLFEFFDRTVGPVVPWVMVNLAVRARKTSPA